VSAYGVAVQTLRSPSGTTLFVRTDFSDDAAWAALRTAVTTPGRADSPPVLTIVDDPALSGAEVADLLAAGPAQDRVAVFFVADTTTLQHPELPVLAVCGSDVPGGSFRVPPAQVAEVADDLLLAGMGWAEFADRVGADGVFRGFSGY
jgi:hypothetical protein